MVTNLLERERELATLTALLHETAAGQGHVAIISGEAGIGKTSLVERAVAQSPTGVRTLWGACEALFAPRPLGPLYDVAQQTASPIRSLLEQDMNRATLFAAVLDDLTQTPTILIVEDIHWADEATLDLIKYLARRIHRAPSLLILTYRDEELGQDHPLRLVLGDLPARGATRLRLLPLSEVAVATLAEHAQRPANDLHRTTGGNPFFVTEALVSDAPGIPRTVSDAVLARVARRSLEARLLLDLVAVVPNRIERWIVEALGGGNEAALDECLAAGVLHLDGRTLAFRHELARQAVESALSPARRQALNAQILHVLLGSEVQPVSLARLAHHATAAENAALVLRFVPEAARQAATQGAHREAVAHYEMALRYDDQMTSEQQAELLDELSDQHYLTGRVEEAIATSEVALARWRALDHTEKVGRTLRRLSRLNWLLGKNVEADRHGLAAVEVLETLPPGRELAMAYGNLAHLDMRADDGVDSLRWGERAIALAEHLGDYETLSYALNTVGAVEIFSGDEEGCAKLEQSLALALEYGYEDHAARAYANLALYRVVRREYTQAERYLQEGIAYCAERDLDPWGHFLRWVQARSHLDRGDWDAAEQDATAILSISWIAVTNRIPALLVLGRVRARRGDPSAEAVLDEARDLALATGELQRIESVAAARAEWRWLHGDLVGCATEASTSFHAEFIDRRPWYQGELVIWLWRGGELTIVPDGVPAPYRLQMAGDWRAASDAWERIGCPYEQALVLLDGDETAQRAALAIFERLDAAPAAEIARRRLRARGARGLRRGPNRITRANPRGLTNRELDVLLLLAEGLRNAEVADRLTISPRTAEQYVAGVLMKLNARSRAEAVSRAYELGLLSQTSSTSDARTK